jgi:hypothetical protein
MKFKVTGLAVVLGLALVMVLSSISDSLATVVPIKVKGGGSATFVHTESFDSGDSVLLTGSGKDNVGGAFTFQAHVEYSDSSSGACTAPDSSAGLQYDLVAANRVNTYNSTFGQVFLSAVPSAGNSECVSNTTDSIGGATTFTVNGGSDKFKAYSGSVTETFIGEIMAGGGSGLNGNAVPTFSAYQFNSTGSVTK